MEYKTEIMKLVDFLEKNHIDFYRKYTKEELLQFINENIDNIKNNDDYQLFIMRILAKVGDPHTTMDIGKVNYAIKFHINNNSLYCQFNNDLMEISSINGFDINQILSELENYVSFDNESHKIAVMEDLLSNEEFMKKFLKSSEINYQSLPGFTFNLANIPLKDKDFNSTFNYILLEDGTFLIKYGSCNSNLYPNIEQFIKETINVLSNNQVTKVIVDLTGNKGGNSSLIKPLISKLSQLDCDKEVIVDKHTFSSAVLAMYDLKSIGAKVAGEVPGLTQNHFGNCKKIELPLSKFNIWYSTSEFILVNGKIIKIDNEKKTDNVYSVNVYGKEYTVDANIVESRNDFLLDEYIELFNNKSENIRR